MTYRDYQINYHVTKAQKRQKQEERKRAIAKACITIIGIIILALMFIGASRSEQKDYTEETIVVRTGTDTATLWNIAVAYGPNDMSINKYISITKKDNQLTSNTIYHGQVLTIRIYED